MDSTQSLSAVDANPTRSRSMSLSRDCFPMALVEIIGTASGEAGELVAEWLGHLGTEAMTVTRR